MGNGKWDKMAIIMAVIVGLIVGLSNLLHYFSEKGLPVRMIAALMVIFFTCILLASIIWARTSQKSEKK